MNKNRVLFRRIYIIIVLILLVTTIAGIQAIAATSSSNQGKRVNWKSNTKDKDIEIPDGTSSDSGQWESTTYSSSDEGSSSASTETQPMSTGAEYGAIVAGLLGVLAVNAAKSSSSGSSTSTPSGNGIWVPEANRDSVVKMINDAASKQYYIDSNGFVKEVPGAVEDLTKSSTYSSVLDRLINGNNKVVIGVDSGWVSYGKDGLQANAFTGDNNGITIGDNGTPQVVIVNGEDTADSPVDITLAHELTHALRGELGIKSMDPTGGVNKDEEANTIDVENRIREELGYDVRTDGDSSDGGDGSYGQFSDAAEEKDWYNNIDNIKRSTTLSGNAYSYDEFDEVMGEAYAEAMAEEESFEAGFSSFSFDNGLYYSDTDYGYSNLINFENDYSDSYNYNNYLGYDNNEYSDNNSYNYSDSYNCNNYLGYDSNEYLDNNSYNYSDSYNYNNYLDYDSNEYLDNNSYNYSDSYNYNNYLDYDSNEYSYYNSYNYLDNYNYYNYLDYDYNYDEDYNYNNYEYDFYNADNYLSNNYYNLNYEDELYGENSYLNYNYNNINYKYDTYESNTLSNYLNGSSSNSGTTNFLSTISGLGTSSIEDTSAINTVQTEIFSEMSDIQEEIEKSIEESQEVIEELNDEMSKIFGDIQGLDSNNNEDYYNYEDDTEGGSKALDDVVNKYSDDIYKYNYKEGVYKPTEVTTKNYDKLDEIAEEMYDSFRSTSDDVEKIAKNTGWDIKDINQIKEHVFLDEVMKDSGMGRLDPDYEMAMAWERLEKGEFYDNDILLLKHELYESTYYRMNNCTQREAHDATTKIFDWNGYVESLR